MRGRYLPLIPPSSLASSQMKMQIVPDSHGQNTLGKWRQDERGVRAIQLEHPRFKIKLTLDA